MKAFTLILASIPLVLNSCAPVHKHAAGGGAFDQSVMARSLDANSAPPVTGYGDNRSFDEVRNYKELREMEELGE